MQTGINENNLYDSFTEKQKKGGVSQKTCVTVGVGLCILILLTTIYILHDTNETQSRKLEKIYH